MLGLSPWFTEFSPKIKISSGMPRYSEDVKVQIEDIKSMLDTFHLHISS